MAAPALVEITPERKLRFNLHDGQQQAFWSDKRFILVLAGLQSGKTTSGPIWLWQEMKRKGPGDYLVAAPTFPLMELKVIPEFRQLFVKTLASGTYQASPIRVFHLSEAGEIRLWGSKQDTPTRVVFGYGAEPDSLESATIKGAWLDEPGQKRFRRESWIAIQGRLALNQGRCLMTTTPYYLGWLKSELYDPWKAAKDAGTKHPDIEVINFASTMNPMFPQDEFERVRNTLPGWLFRMRYMGLFERPAGLIYDCWNDNVNDPDANVIPQRTLPAHWPRFTGLDFGGVNTAGLFVAKEMDEQNHPTRRYIGYREYHAGGRTAAQHVAELIRGEPRTPTAIGGSKSEDQWRSEFASAGLGVWPPVVSDVEVGILRAYSMIQEKKFVVFDTLTGFRDQVTSYSRELNEAGEPTEKIEDKETYHYLDAARYLLSYLWTGLDGALMA